MFLMKKLIRLLITMRSIDLIETYIYMYIYGTSKVLVSEREE